MGSQRKGRRVDVSKGAVNEPRVDSGRRTQRAGEPLTERPNLVWGAPTAAERGPVIATLRKPHHRNAVSSHCRGILVLARSQSRRERSPLITYRRPDRHRAGEAIRGAIAARRIPADGDIVRANGDVRVTKAAIDPVWYLPGIARALQHRRGPLRRSAARADRRHVSRNSSRGPTSRCSCRRSAA